MYIIYLGGRNNGRQNNEVISDEVLNSRIAQANSIVKILFAIMNEEDDIDAYAEKTPEEMTDIVKLVDARFPEKKVASYDPVYTLFGQIFRNGYNTFGIDFMKNLLRRTDEAPSLCYKGLNDIIENLEIMQDKMETIISVLLKLIIEAPDEDRIAFKQAMESGQELSDIEFLDKYFKEVEEEAMKDMQDLIEN